MYWSSILRGTNAPQKTHALHTTSPSVEAKSKGTPTEATACSCWGRPPQAGQSHNKGKGIWPPAGQSSNEGAGSSLQVNFLCMNFLCFPLPLPHHRPRYSRVQGPGSVPRELVLSSASTLINLGSCALVYRSLDRSRFPCSRVQGLGSVSKELVLSCASALVNLGSCALVYSFLDRSRFLRSCVQVPGSVSRELVLSCTSSLANLDSCARVQIP